eukprot:CAMPEP_0171497008 /NCGR_PEP_ID=MMETSP0958-20121227/7024_1 /TAXON_ID=87120 /ORGANISM="Aurantiochytrium limacinum, Strain ATCCMYA-1381" /LENGTH=282 /DNA_ID=CAMNT_0012031185 /DNA_START=59 /DNA_END=907 /DNA_ORIENTATION=+
MMNLRTVIVVFIMALLVHEGKADCSGSASPDSCEIWSALQDNFGGASWTACGTSATNSRYINPCGSKKCPFTSGFVTCDGNVITSFNFNSENNLVAEADISSFVSMLETYRDSYNFQTLTLQNQASLALDECLAPCADGVTCDFTGSECTGSCTTDGICVTDAPTSGTTSSPTAAPTATPTAAPTAATSAPTDSTATSAPTDSTATSAPSAAPTVGSTTSTPTIDVDNKGNLPECNSTLTVNCTTITDVPTAAPTFAPSAAGTIEVGLVSAIVMLANHYAFW